MLIGLGAGLVSGMRGLWARMSVIATLFAAILEIFF
jgi:hypothetical protein